MLRLTLIESPPVLKHETIYAIRDIFIHVLFFLQIVTKKIIFLYFVHNFFSTFQLPLSFLNVHVYTTFLTFMRSSLVFGINFHPMRSSCYPSNTRQTIINFSFLLITHFSLTSEWRKVRSYIQLWRDTKNTKNALNKFDKRKRREKRSCDEMWTRLSLVYDTCTWSQVHFIISYAEAFGRHLGFISVEGFFQLLFLILAPFRRVPRELRRRSLAPKSTQVVPIVRFTFLAPSIVPHLCPVPFTPRWIIYLANSSVVKVLWYSRSRSVHIIEIVRHVNTGYKWRL